MTGHNDPGKRIRRLLILFCTTALLSAGGIYLLWQLHPDPEYWRERLGAIQSFLEAHPWAILIALGTLPGIGFPISPLFILLGVSMGPGIGLPATCLAGIGAQTFCSIWTYALASGPLRGFCRDRLFRNRKLPAVTGENAVRLSLIVRLTPGFPYPLQNIALGVMAIPFRTYLFVSIPASGLYAVGFITTGGALFQGRGGLALTAALLLVVLILLTRFVRARGQEKKTHVG